LLSISHVSVRRITVTKCSATTAVVIVSKTEESRQASRDHLSVISTHHVIISMTADM